MAGGAPEARLGPAFTCLPRRWQVSVHCSAVPSCLGTSCSVAGPGSVGVGRAETTPQPLAPGCCQDRRGFAPLTLLHCPHTAPPTLPEGPPALPAAVPMFPVPPPGPGEPAPGFAAPGFAEPSGPDPAARYPGPGLPPSASSLPEGAHLLRAQDPGGSVCEGSPGAEPNGPTDPGGGVEEAAVRVLGPGSHGARGECGLHIPPPRPPVRLPLSWAWRLRGHRDPLCH